MWDLMAPPGQGYAFEPHGPIAGHRLGARHGATTLGATAARGWDNGIGSW